MEQLRAYLQQNILVTDGAIGTYYAMHTERYQTLSEHANLHDGETILKIHKEYIEAGAKLIRTNTFSANCFALQKTREEVCEILQRGYSLAASAVEESGKAVYIAASIGPIMTQQNISYEELMEEYRFIIDTLITCGAKIILFETFSNITHAKALVDYITMHYPDIEIMAQFALNSYGYTKKGTSAKRIIEELQCLKGIVAGGFNCGVGVGHLHNIVRHLEWQEEFNLVTIPNSSYPETHHHRLLYQHNPSYFTDNMVELVKQGVRVVGGCCGTTPEYIRRLIAEIDQLEKPYNRQCPSKHQEAIEVVPKANDFYQKLCSGKKPIAVELDPPFGVDITKVMDGAHHLANLNVDMITVADSPLGKARADSMMIASKIQREADISTMPHVCCRDKNSIALKAQLFASYIEGIRNMLVVTGDPIPSSDRNEISSVFNMNSMELMELVAEMNIEHFSEAPICFGGALNPNRKNIEVELKRVRAKIKAGASYFLTQPIYTEQAIDNLRYIKSAVDTKILVGIMPLVSIRNAKFIQNQLPGIDVPDEVVMRFNETMTKQEAEAIGVEIAVEMMKKVSDVVDGYYMIIPFNRTHLITRLIDSIKVD